MSFCYSDNGEEFHGEFDTEEDAAEGARDEYGCECESVFIGEVVPAIDFFDGRRKAFAEDILLFIYLWMSDCPTTYPVVNISLT